jgi:diguanylate cyclase (GGDEF)-like protein
MEHKDLKIALAKALRRVETLEREVKNLSHQAFVDDMTGLPNYRAFCQRMDQAMAEFQRGRAFSLVMVDVDFFKRVNDTFGHSVGDDVLRHVAAVLHAASREVDFIGRYGGEEFCMVLSDASPTVAYDVAERARKALANTPFGCIDLTASFGVCTFGPGMVTSDIIKHADGSLYRAKGLGRNRVEVYSA